MLRKIFVSILFMLVAISYGQVLSGARAVPKMLNYQGYLTDTLGSPIDDTLNMTFKIYNAATLGTVLWSETQTNIPIERGVFSLLLGNVNLIPDTVFTTGTDRWLELTLEGPQTLSPRTRITAVGYAYTATYADTAQYAANAATDNDWVRGTPDSVLFSSNVICIARGDADNMFYGDSIYTHINFGIACTTGASGQSHAYATVSGGGRNTANGSYATVAGGRNNTASGAYSAIGGGDGNTADTSRTTVAGGYVNTAGGSETTVCGGWGNEANGSRANVGGGYINAASGDYATVSGGWNNTADGNQSNVCGGFRNTTTGDYATVSGGWDNLASGHCATVAGGRADTSEASYAFTAGWGSTVYTPYHYSAAFNGQTATASSQTRVGALSKASGTFTIDHPLDPMNKILNHYFVESPEMVLIYRGSATIGADGRAVVHLPEYFDALNKNPLVQLTGVGTSNVFLVKNVRANDFVIGGTPGTEVHWTVTGERKDQSAEITRIIMPVEQIKEGNLAGRSLDDDFLASTMSQLERMGEEDGFRFRTARGRKKYEEMKRRMAEKQ